MSYVTHQDIIDRIGLGLLVPLADDDDDGVPDARVLDRLTADAEAIVNSYMRGLYEIPFTAPVPTVVQNITLDLVEAFSYRRRPEVARRDWPTMLDMAHKTLEKIRLGKMRLDVMTTPEPAKNEGGMVRSGNPAAPEPKRKFFLDGTGDF